MMTRGTLWQRFPWKSAIFNVLYLTLGSLFAFQTNNWEFMFYFAVLFVIGLGILEIHRRLDLPGWQFGLLTVWGMLHVIGGLVPLPAGWTHTTGKAVFYSWDVLPGMLRYDQIVHAFGFAVATMICWECLVKTLQARSTQLGVVLLAVLASLGLGATNELIEFIATRFLDTNVGGYENTGWDLVSNTVGAVAAGIAIALFDRRREPFP